jgi:hypothetical protein
MTGDERPELDGKIMLAQRSSGVRT